MSLQILGAGFGRTGTLSLKVALEQLGYVPCHHMVEIERGRHGARAWLRAARGESVAWRSLLSPYVAAVDWPAAAFWREVLAEYPTLRVVLTVRDAADWYASFRETILAKARGPVPPRGSPMRGIYDLAREVVLRRTFGGRADDAGHAIAVYERHRREVIAAVPPERLLLFDVASGWVPLCRFLGYAVPSGAFPLTNSRAEFSRQYGHVRRPNGDRPSTG